MTKYKKKPIVIDAVQWTGKRGNLLEITQLNTGTRLVEKEGDKLFIPTLEGLMQADLNDWIIRGVKGEIYPCKPDIFEMLYDKVDGP